MTKYRHALPQLSGSLFFTDGGLETTLVFHDGIDLPYFASFPLLETPDGRARIAAYFEQNAQIALRCGAGFALDTPTWRANPDWTGKLGLDAELTAAVNRNAAVFIASLRDRLETPESPMVVSGTIGPRGDGYQVGTRMSAEAARAYHAPQVGAFADSPVDMVSAYTLTYAAEAVGIVRAARAVDVPVVISFTVETDGRLPSGETLGAAIETVDRETDDAAAYFMLNCAHPTHFGDVLADAVAKDEPWIGRLRGLRANASALSHADLDEAETLDDGNPQELGRQYASLLRLLPQLTILGGCCGTDHRHVEQIGLACARGPGSGSARAA